MHSLGLGTVHILNRYRYRYLKFGILPNGTFFRYFTLCVATKTFIQNSQFQNFEQ